MLYNPLSELRLLVFNRLVATPAGDSYLQLIERKIPDCLDQMIPLLISILIRILEVKYRLERYAHKAIRSAIIEDSLASTEEEEFSDTHLSFDTFLRNPSVD